MAAQIKVELNSAGIVELLKSKGVQDDLTRRGEAVANMAGPEDYASRTWLGFDRARATISPTTYKGRADEAKEKRLTRSIDAARR